MQNKIKRPYILKISFLISLLQPTLNITCGARQYVDSYTVNTQTCTTDEAGTTTCVPYSYTAYRCKNCVSPCYTCSSSKNCKSCFPNSGHYLHKGTGTYTLCWGSCPPPYFERNYTGASYSMGCTRCDTTCQDCWNTGNNNCVKCIVGMKLMLDGSCTTDCPDGQFSNPATEDSCQLCHHKCQTCFSGTKYSCLTCKPESPYYLPDKSCDIKCKDDQFISDPTNKYCSTCHPDCESCFGSSKTQCHRCKNEYVMDLKLECIPECRIGTYRYNETHCYPCVSGCAECLGPGIRNCTKCMPDTYMYIDAIFRENSLIIAPGQDPETASMIGESSRVDRHKYCYPNCKTGFYNIDGTGTNGFGECHRCHGLCRNCRDAAATDCLNCVGNMTFLAKNSSCECNEGYFVPGNIKEERGGYCEVCYETCLKCNDPAENACFKCKTAYYLKDGKCIRDCGDKFYKEGLSEGKTQNGFEECLNCHETCLNCLGSEKGDCYECPEPYIKIKHISFMNRGECLDCFNDFDADGADKLCWEVRHLTLKVEKKARDGYSSRSVYMSYENDFYFKEKIEQLNHNLTDYFEVK